MVATLVKMPYEELMARQYSVEEYLDVEHQIGERFAFYNGTIVLMAGGTIKHNLIVSNIIYLLQYALDDKKEMYVFGSDQKIYLPKFNYYVYPDAVVVSAEPIVSEKGHGITNPLLIVEVLSPSTENYDKGEKFMEYQTLPSFKEYVLIRQDAAEVATMYREAPDLWRNTAFEGIENELYLKSLDLSIPMAKIYKKVL